MDWRGIDMVPGQSEQMKRTMIAKLAGIMKHCEALEADADLCGIERNRLELIKILTVIVRR